MTEIEITVICNNCQRVNEVKTELQRFGKDNKLKCEHCNRHLVTVKQIK